MATSDDEDRDLEREIRANRKFSLKDAIGQRAGGDFMKDGSPITRKRQAELELDDYLRGQLVDSQGVLRRVLLLHVGESLMHADFKRPFAVLAAYIERVLASDQLLEPLVRAADMEWGRVHGERPHFQLPGRAPHPDDPFTIESVRVALLQLRDTLASREKS